MVMDIDVGRYLICHMRSLSSMNIEIDTDVAMDMNLNIRIDKDVGETSPN